MLVDVIVFTGFKRDLLDNFANKLRDDDAIAIPEPTSGKAMRQRIRAIPQPST